MRRNEDRGESPEPARALPRGAAGKDGRRVRQLKMIGREPLSAVIDLAVARSLRTHLGKLDPTLGFAVRDATAREFMRLLRDNVKNVRGVSKERFLADLERERDRVVLARNQARQELSELERKVVHLRALRRAETQEFAAKNALYVEQRSAELTEEVRALFARHERGELDDRGLEHAVLALATGLVRSERQELFDARSIEQADLLDNFQRRIAKLTAKLEETERTVAALAKMKDVEPGIASVYRTVQGLAEGDSLWRVKEELLMRIYEANLTLQGK